MSDRFELFGFTIEEVHERTEVNYLVYNSDYFCRLIPSENGFVMSTEDEHAFNKIPGPVLRRISDQILQRNA